MLLILVMAGLGLAAAQNKSPRGPGSYFISFSRDLHRGLPFNVNVDILNTSYPVRVRAELQRMFYNLTQYYKIPVAGAEGDFVQGRTGLLQLNAPSVMESGRYILHVRGSGGLQFEREKDVSFTYKTISIMVQTDKAMYKPGQKVRFRVVGTYPNLQVYTGGYQVTITDSNWNKVKQFNLESGTGVVVGDFQLADRTVFGDWRISVQPETQVETKTQTFTVAEYKLPRFEVSVDLPKFAVTSDEMLSGSVKAKYTFGKNVKGMVELRARIDTYNNPCGPPPQYVQQAFPIDGGEAKFSIPLVDLKRLRNRLEGQTIDIVAIVKEELTGVRLNGSNTIEFHQYPYKIEILSSSPQTFSPKLPYSAIIKVSQPDGSPLGITTFPVSVYTCVKYREVQDDQSMYGCREFSGSYGLPGQNHSLPTSGILPVHMRIPKNAMTLEIKAHYREVTDTHTVKKKNSVSDNYMQIRLATSGITAGQLASFLIEYTETVTSFTYQILSRGSVAPAVDVPSNGQNPVSFQVPITHGMAPVAYIVVYYVRSTGEVVADSISFTVNEVFDNEVSVVFSRNESLPNRAIDVTMTAEPQSSVNLLAIDQSVLLLKSGNDITTEKVLDELKTYGSSVTNGDFSPEVYAIASSAGRAPDIFSNAGLNVITDAQYYDHFYQQHNFGGYSAGFGGAPMPRPTMAFGGRAGRGMANEMMAADSGAILQKASPGAPPPGLKKVERVRTVFPETWLWLSQSVGPNGKATITSTVPDTITSWVASAFAVHPSSGLGVAPTAAKLRVFQTFFVSLTMPSSVLRGETVIIQASIFNYLTNDVDVSVSMPSSPDYVSVVFDASGKPRQESKLQNLNLRVKSNQPQTVYFPIIPKTIGTINIEVNAQSNIAADAVKRQLVVHSEGIRKEYNVPLFVGLTPGGTFAQTIPLTLPLETVRGSEKARIKVTGNLIGTSLDNIENLLSMPMACGEQNMMTFAPNVYIAKYLTRTGKMTPALWSKIIDLLELGLQRQLTYQRTDGSFSPFGNRDEAGSMWLTAFVSQSFHEAREYILVDNSTLTRALNWMMGRQNRDGSFNEPGLVIDKKTQRSRSALTAHVLLSLMENRDILETSGPNKAYQDATSNAVKYLEGAAPSITDLYSQAVVSYALIKAGSPVADIPFNALNAAAKFQGSLKFWTETATPSTPTPTPLSSYYKSWIPPHVIAQPLDIQITSYALLSYTVRGDIRGGFPITMWLSTQKNPHGGFSSSQDTIVALRALTEFAQRIRMSGFQVNLNFTGASDFIQVAVTAQNALVLQSRELTTFPNEITVVAAGVGVAYTEIDVFYHVNAEIGNPSFEVNAVLLEDAINTYRLMVCSKWLKEDSTGMAVMEVAIASGFEPDMTSIGNVAGIKRVERRGRDVNVYFDQIGKSTICFNLLATRTGMVSTNQKSYITVYDYYQPENQASIFYQPRSLATSTICDVCANCCPQVK